MYCIECINISKSFKDSANLKIDIIRNVSLAIKPAERIAIIGASGAGKSTFLHILSGLDAPDSGIVRILNRELYSLNDYEKSKIRNNYIGFVYQSHHLLKEFNVLENVYLPLKISGRMNKEDMERAIYLLSLLGLKNRMKYDICNLSGGERQRVAIARALIKKPLCVFADEPTGNLDEHTGMDVYASLMEANIATKTAIVVATHDRKFASMLDKTLELKNGFLL